MAAIYPENIPAEVKALPQWVMWKKETRDGKPAKVPYQPNGKRAKSNDPSTWSTFNTALTTFQDIGGFDGICWMMHVKPSDIIFIDIDHCIKDGIIEPWAQQIVDEFDSYTERSQSGNGLHILIKGKKPIKRCRKAGSPFEIYDCLRPCYITGDVVGGHTTIEARQEALDWLFEKIFAAELRQARQDPAPKPSPAHSNLSDEALILKATLSKGGNEFKLLFDGSTLGYNGDDSAADMALMNKLAFWTGGNALQMERLFSASGLGRREKWRGRPDYRERTIKKAISDAREFYEPPKDSVNARPKKNKTNHSESQIELEEIADIEYDKNDKIKKVRLSPTLAARAVLGKMPFVMSEDSEEIYSFNGQIYRPDGARKIDRILCEVAGDHVTGDKLRETLRRVKNELLDSPVVFDPNPYLLGVQNGVADLLTGDVREYSPEDLILDQIPVSFDPSARCPVFLAFLESITPNISDRITLIDWFAATAVKEPLAYVLFLLGLGRNGKGIYEKLIKKFFGQAAFRDMPLQEVSKNNFAAGGFYRKRGWIASETGKRKASIGTDFIKLTSGNGVIDSDRKNQSRIQFEPYFQTIVDTNTMPKIDDSSIGWQERFVKVDLPYIYVANPDPANPLERQRDPALFERLSTPNELSGILNLLLFRSKAIGKSKTIHKRGGAEMFAEYNEQSSSVATFLETFCEFDGALSNFWTPLEAIYEAYRTWCSYKVGEVVDIRYFGKQLKKFCGGFEPKKGKDKDRKNTRLYKGLIFDSNKCKASLEGLLLSMSPSSLHVSPSCLHEEEEIQSQQISMSPLSPCNLWNDILEKFGDNSSQKKPQNSPGKKQVNFMETMETMETSTSSKLVEEMPDGDKTETLMETNPTTGPHPRRDEPTPTQKNPNDPGFAEFKAGMAKRRCCLCGRSFPYDLTPYVGWGKRGRICATCHMQGPPPVPAKADDQTRLEDET